MRLVLPLQISPHLIARLRAQGRICVHDILELIHHGPVGDKDAAVLKMHLHIILRPAAEEAVHPRLREEFHGHGMGLRSLHGDIRMLADGIFRSDKSLERMAAFVGDNVRIPAGPVKVREDKRRLVVRQIGHVAASLLGLAADDVKQFVVTHEVHEPAGLRRQFIVHQAAGFQDLSRIAHRLRIALGKINSLIFKMKMIQSEPDPSSLMQLLCKWDEIALYLLSELPDILTPVAVSLHAGIPEIQIVLSAHRSCLLCAVFHQAVIDVIQLFPVLCKELGILFPCFHTDLPVLIVKIGIHQGQVQRLAPPVDLGCCQKHVVFRLDLIFLLHQRKDLLIHGLHRQLHVFEGDFADLLLQIRPVRRLIQLLLISHIQVSDLRLDSVIEVLLFAVIFIRHIDIMPDLGQRHEGHDMICDPVVVLVDRKLLLTRLRPVHPADQFLHVTAHGIHIDPAVGHL